MNEKQLIYDIVMLTHENKTLSYKKLVNMILDKYQKQFRDRDFFLNLQDVSISEIINVFLKYCPFQFSFNSDDIHNRHKLYDDIQTILTPNDNELISIGSGYIGKGGIFVIGMAAGFYTGDADDLISQPFKPSFFFQNTSEILRKGFFKELKSIYFTNASKMAVEKQKMNESYEENYEKYWPILKNEIDLLQPNKILTLGANVYDFLKNKNIECKKVLHPSYWIYRHQIEDGIKYYKDLTKE